MSLHKALSIIFPREIERARQKNKWSYREMSKNTEMCLAACHRYCNGDYPRWPEWQEKICNAMGIKIQTVYRKAFKLMRDDK